MKLPKLKKIEQIKALWKIKGMLKDKKDEINMIAYTHGIGIFLHEKGKIENTAKALEEKLKAGQFDSEAEKLAKKIHKFCKENRRWFGIRLVDFDMKKAEAFRNAVSEGRAEEAIAFLQNDFEKFLLDLQQRVSEMLGKGIL